MDEPACALKALEVFGALIKTGSPVSFKLMSFEAVVTPPVSLTTALVPPSAKLTILLKKVDVPMVVINPLLAGAMAMSQPDVPLVKLQADPPPGATSEKLKFVWVL